MKYRNVLLYILLVLTNQSNGNKSRLPEYMLRRAANKQLDPFGMFSNPLLSSNEPDEVLYAASYKHRKWRNSPFRFSHQRAEKPKGSMAKGLKPNCKIENRQCGCPFGAFFKSTVSDSNTHPRICTTANFIKFNLLYARAYLERRIVYTCYIISFTLFATCWMRNLLS